MQPILAITAPVKKNKGAACQCYGDGDGIAWCAQTLNEVIGIKSIIQFETLFSKPVLDHFEICYIK